jgi:hypothetical protein
MLTPEPAVALAEVHRVLAPAGRAGIMVWAGPEHNAWLTGLGMAAMANGVTSGGPPVGPGGVFSLGEPDHLLDLVTAAGFHDAAVEAVDLVMTFTDVDHYVAVAGSLAPPLAAALRTATPDQRASVRATAADLLAGFRADRGLLIPGRALLATGRA